MAQAETPENVQLRLQLEFHSLPADAYSAHLEVALQALLLPHALWGDELWDVRYTTALYNLYEHLDAEDKDLNSVVSLLAMDEVQFHAACRPTAESSSMSNGWRAMFMTPDCIQELFTDAEKASEQRWLLGEVKRRLRRGLQAPAGQRYTDSWHSWDALAEKALENPWFGPMTMSAARRWPLHEHSLTFFRELKAKGLHQLADDCLRFWSMHLPSSAMCGVFEALLSELALQEPPLRASEIAEVAQAMYPAPRVEDIADDGLRQRAEQAQRLAQLHLAKETALRSHGQNEDALMSIIEYVESVEVGRALETLQRYADEVAFDEVALREGLASFRGERLTLLKTHFAAEVIAKRNFWPLLEQPLDRLLDTGGLLAQARWLWLVPWDLRWSQGVSIRYEQILTSFIERLLAQLPATDIFSPADLPQVAASALAALAQEIVSYRHRISPAESRESLPDEVAAVRGWLTAAVIGWWRGGVVDPGWTLQMDCATTAR